MTIGELKTAIADLPDDLEILIDAPDDEEYLDVVSVAQSADGAVFECDEFEDEEGEDNET